jgi:hypothetical protein
MTGNCFYSRGFVTLSGVERYSYFPTHVGQVLGLSPVKVNSINPSFVAEAKTISSKWGFISTTINVIIGTYEIASFTLR